MRILFCWTCWLALVLSRDVLSYRSGRHRTSLLVLPDFLSTCLYPSIRTCLLTYHSIPTCRTVFIQTVAGLNCWIGKAVFILDLELIVVYLAICRARIEFCAAEFAVYYLRKFVLRARAVSGEAVPVQLLAAVRAVLRIACSWPVLLAGAQFGAGFAVALYFVRIVLFCTEFDCNKFSRLWFDFEFIICNDCIFSIDKLFIRN